MLPSSQVFYSICSKSRRNKVKGENLISSLSAGIFEYFSLKLQCIASGAKQPNWVFLYMSWCLVFDAISRNFQRVQLS